MYRNVQRAHRLATCQDSIYTAPPGERGAPAGPVTMVESSDRPGRVRSVFMPGMLACTCSDAHGVKPGSEFLTNGNQQQAVHVAI